MSAMQKPYRGKLTPSQRASVDYATDAGDSARSIAKAVGVPYGQVRGYLEWKNSTTTDLIPPPSAGPKILVFDIETAPYTSFTWSLFKTNVIDVKEEWYMLSFAYGWYDIETQTLGPVQWVGLPQDPKFKAWSADDSYIINRLWTLFDEAEIVVGQNHERFDMKKGQERMFIHKMTPPAPYATLDTKRIWKQNFSGSASLKYMTRKADVAMKQPNRGFEMWKDCMADVAQGWTEMEEYNVADVVATAELFTRLIPWIDTPISRTVNFGHYKPGDWTCKKCMNQVKERGGLGFVRRGFHGTGASRFQTVMCKKCKGYSRLYQRVPQRHNDDKTFLR